MARTPSERQGSLDTLYKEACDPSTSPSRLSEIWSETKSTKIRKAIASNLNCDPQTMKLASRLYVEEVIKNGSFQLLKTFEEDPFVLATLLLTIPRCLLSRLQRISRAQFVKLPFSDRDYTLSVGPRHNRMVQAEAIDTRVIGQPLSFLAWILF